MIADDMRELIALFNHSDLVELAIEQRGRKLVLRKGQTLPGELPAEPEPATPEPAVYAVKAHMVGQFYWSKDKADTPTVEIGRHVDKGQVVGVIEAMGLFNDVEAGHSGTVTDIPAAHGQPVEYGQPIVVLQPD